MTRWILEKSDGFTDVGFLKMSESVRAYAYLILSFQASARSGIVDNTASALTAPSAFLNNFESVVNRKVNIGEDIKRYQDTLSYASNKVNYSMGQNIYMLLSDMNLKIMSGTVGCNNQILVSDEKFSLGKNVKVNSLVLEPVIPVPKDHLSHKAVAQQTHAHELAKKPTHEDEKIAVILFLTGGFVRWNIFHAELKSGSQSLIINDDRNSDE